MTVAFESRFIDVNQVRLHCVTAGHGPLMLFLHGFPEFWGAWKDQLREFGRDHLVAAPDMRGYNRSSKPPDPEAYHVTTLLEDIRALILELGHQKAIIVAHDWGGAVAWALAARRPETVEKLIIINAPHPSIFARELLHNPAQQEASQYMRLFRSPEAERILSANNFAFLREKVFSEWGGKWEMRPGQMEEYIDAWSQPGALTGGLNYYRASPLFPPESEAERERIRQIRTLPHQTFAVKVPTLVIWGEQDSALLTGNLEGLADLVDDLSVARIPEATHWVVHEAPGQVNGLIREFIKRG